MLRALPWLLREAADNPPQLRAGERLGKQSHRTGRKTLATFPQNPQGIRRPNSLGWLAPGFNNFHLLSSPDHSSESEYS